MPLGKTHDRITWIFYPPFAYMAWDFSENITIVTLYSIAYLFSSFMFSGDLDLVSQQSRRWGILRWIWIPYRKMFRHRSKFTHGIVLGTIIRIVYLFLIFSIFFSLLYFVTFKTSPFLHKELTSETAVFLQLTSKQPKTYFLAIFLGLTCGALVHTLSDELFSALKRMFRPKNKKTQKKLKKQNYKK
jgi:uncharacterized metal-binding protein